MKKVFKTAAFLLAMGLMTSTFTSCGEDDENNVKTDEELNDEIASVVNFDGLKAIALADGKIKIVGEITSDKKLKEFEVIDASENVLATLGDKNTTTKDKEIDENGKKVKRFTMTVTSDPIDVQILKFRIKAGVKNPMTSGAIGEAMNVTIGSASSETGSYLSLADNHIYKYAEAKDNASKIDVIAKSSGKSGDKDRQVLGIQRASKAADAQVGTNAGKTALFDGDGNKIEDDSYVLKGTIITDGPDDACIAKFTVTPNASGTADMEGVIIKNSPTLPLDVTAFTFSK
jgi:hypothetical protein